VGSPDEALISSPLVWRGAPADIANALAGDKFNDADATKAEVEAWKAATPKNKGTVDNLPDLNNLAQKCILAGSMRARAEIPKDVNDSKLDPMAAADILAPILKETVSIKDRLDAFNIDMDNPTGGGTPGSGNTGTDVPAGQTVALNNASSLLGDMTPINASAQNRYNAVVAKNNCKMTKCTGFLAAAEMHRGMMNKYQGEVAGYKTELEGKAPVSSERLAFINGRMQEIKTKMDPVAPKSHPTEFDTNMKEVEKLSGISNTGSGTVKPPQTIINIQNNVGATANANANANANSTANSTVKPPVIPPVVKPTEKPKPEPSPNLSVTMADGKSMTLARSEFYPANGKAVYTGWHRLEGTEFLILAKSAFNYRVTCGLSGEKYSITKTELTPVAFPAKEEGSWITKVLIKKFLRMEDIQMGKWSNSQLFIGKSCHQ
jgi:hypothetical protein